MKKKRMFSRLSALVLISLVLCMGIFAAVIVSLIVRTNKELKAEK